MVGAVATFEVLASGTKPLSFQWRKNRVALDDGGTVSGATRSTLILAIVFTTGVANYTADQRGDGGVKKVFKRGKRICPAAETIEVF